MKIILGLLLALPITCAAQLTREQCEGVAQIFNTIAQQRANGKSLEDLLQGDAGTTDNDKRAYVELITRLYQYRGSQQEVYNNCMTPSAPQAAQPGQMVQDSSHESLCTSYGLVKGTAAYADCMFRLRQQDASKAERERQEQTAREAARVEQEAAQRNYYVCLQQIRRLPQYKFKSVFDVDATCRADPQAHLRPQPPQPPSYDCTRFGNTVSCDPR